MSRNVHRLSTLVAVALFAGCGPKPDAELHIDFSAEKMQIGAGKYVTITVTGAQNGKAGLLNDLDVKFSTDLGTFDTADGEQSYTGLTAGGFAEVKFFAPDHPGTAKVNVQFNDAFTQKVVKASATFEWTTPPVERLEFSCGSKNIMAFNSTYDIKVKCTVSAEDDAGNAVPGAVVKFRTEAGSMEKDDDGNWVYNPRVGSRQAPVDLDPLGDSTTGEPRWLDPSSSKTHNPRDGLVTIVAWVEGTEGVSGEPFVDVDDDGEFTAKEQAFYEDINNNGSRDDDTGPIWQAIKIMWSGQSSMNAAVAGVQFQGGSGTLEKDACKRLTFTVVDDNFNILAANAAGDRIQFQVNTDGVVNFDGADFSTLPTGYGLALDSRGRLQNGTSRASYMVGASHSVTVCNGNTEGSDDSTYQVYGSTQRNTFVDATGEPSGDPPDGETTIFSPRATLKGVPAL